MCVAGGAGGLVGNSDGNRFELALALLELAVEIFKDMDRLERHFQAILLGQGGQQCVTVIVETDNFFSSQGGEVLDESLCFFLDGARFPEVNVSNGTEVVRAFDNRQIIEKRIVQKFTNHISHDAQIQHGLALFAFFHDGRQIIELSEILHSLLGNAEGTRFFLALVQQIEWIGLGRADQIARCTSNAETHNRRCSSRYELLHFLLRPLEVVFHIRTKLQALST